MNAFKAFLIGAGVAAVLSAGPAACAAQAATHHHPSERARIHALEKKVNHLEDVLADDEADLTQLMDRMVQVEKQESITRERLARCFTGWPMQTISIPDPSGGMIQVFEMNATAPGLWVAVVNPGCINTDLQPRMAR